MNRLSTESLWLTHENGRFPKIVYSPWVRLAVRDYCLFMLMAAIVFMSIEKYFGSRFAALAAPLPVPLVVPFRIILEDTDLPSDPLMEHIDLYDTTKT